MRHRILVVDDEVTIGQALRRSLFGYDVTPVTTARDGLDRIAKGERFDAIVCDLHMPEMDGLEFARELALTTPDLAAKILMLTADHHAAKELAGFRVLTKPFETHVFRSRIEELVRPTPRPAPPTPSSLPTPVPPAASHATHDDAMPAVSQRPTMPAPKDPGGG